MQSSSCGTCFSAHSIGLGAACPSPQIEASSIVRASSFSSGASHLDPCISASAFAVPARHGVHCPHDSSLKNARRLRAASVARSRSDRITTAAEPMKHPCSLSVSKSSGMSAIDAGRMPPDAPPGR